MVCTVRHHGLAHDKLLMVEMIDPQGNPNRRSSCNRCC
ncbi:ethanolamine utilization protein EutN [Escherichia coli]|nr:ethanolamine utilization protein EutN [Escherichia coli]